MPEPNQPSLARTRRRTVLVTQSAVAVAGLVLLALFAQPVYWSWDDPPWDSTFLLLVGGAALLVGGGGGLIAGAVSRASRKVGVMVAVAVSLPGLYIPAALLSLTRGEPPFSPPGVPSSALLGAWLGWMLYVAVLTAAAYLVVAVRRFPFPKMPAPKNPWLRL